MKKKMESYFVISRNWEINLVLLVCFWVCYRYLLHCRTILLLIALRQIIGQLFTNLVSVNKAVNQNLAVICLASVNSDNRLSIAALRQVESLRRTRYLRQSIASYGRVSTCCVRVQQPNLHRTVSASGNWSVPWGDRIAIAWSE